jgi:hypothetical protein
MIRDEQNVLLSREYAEAIRYMDNAKAFLQKAGKDGRLYTDPKYVRTACGTAYNGVLIALDAWFALKELPKLSKKQRKSIDYYMAGVSGIDRKMASFLHTAYNVLHLDGYYDGITSIKTIESGFDAAYEIIEKIKPENFVEIKETRGQGAKRVLNNLLISAAVMFS